MNCPRCDQPLVIVLTGRDVGSPMRRWRGVEEKCQRCDDAERDRVRDAVERAARETKTARFVRELRDAGGDGWDDIDDPEAFLNADDSEGGTI